ncbi:MAG: hypothetical protein IPG76_00205 [Acidobacteria bacterium]|nr:hypothetical protein [Acidobacteriota bacterium]
MMTAIQKTLQEVEVDEEALQPLEVEDESLERDYDPASECITSDDFDTCSRLTTAAQLTVSPSRMCLKRSLSPDGGIDSVSIEIDLSIGGLSAQEIKARGLKALELETEITEEYLAGLPPAAKTKTQNSFAEGNGLAVPAKLVDIGKTNNNCHFINVKLGEKTARLFGSRKQLVIMLAKAGQDLTPEAISEGLRLDFACRAITRPSSDGKYLNVVELLPAA